ncbi:DUF5906 domain-containing protein [Methylobacterium sp. CB376]|uniref:primase-helicase family protein n=1 Tax=unclassified Methylobacterium TaxID=2615210 RepID=UPI00223FC234|nr:MULTISPECIES: primase-helicase family protein [Methylobacterium]WFT83728.1 DUF5906 domain-containing protein [Methylobacterium nodulans]
MCDRPPEPDEPAEAAKAIRATVAAQAIAWIEDLGAAWATGTKATKAKAPAATAKAPAATAAGADPYPEKNAFELYGDKALGPWRPNLPDRAGFRGRYLSAVVSAEVRAVSEKRETGRNIQLNVSSHNLGRYVGAGALDAEDVKRWMYAAAVACRYVETNGEAQAWATIESGLTAGMAKPRTPPPPAPPGGYHDALLAEMNEKYCVVMEGGKTRVLTFNLEHQDGHSREAANFLSFEDFRNFYINKTVRISEDKKKKLGHWWLEHPDRRQYNGLIFEPEKGREVDGQLNLWRGFAIQPQPGDWTRLRRHIREVLAAGDAEADRYIIAWLAWLLQNPGRRAEVALVFKGTKGTGKGTLGNALCRILGQHATHISDAEHLSGRFNAHLRDACFLFADEAYWPGDKSAEGSLKRLITEPDLFIEGKGRDGVTVPNRLHVLMASNEDWIVPAGADERRFAVFAVSDVHKQDPEWFGPLYDEMEAGGLAAMLHDLLAFDLKGWHPRQVVRTAALVEQQERSLRPLDEWWVELLETGILEGADPREPNRAVSTGWDEEVPAGFNTRSKRRRGLFDQAREMSPKLKTVSDRQLGSYLKSKGCSNHRKVMRRQGWTFPPLAQLRAEWEALFPGWPWGRAVAEWHTASGSDDDAECPNKPGSGVGDPLF